VNTAVKFRHDFFACEALTGKAGG